MKIEKLGVVSRDVNIYNMIRQHAGRLGIGYTNKISELPLADVIICAGGDGTFLHAERYYPAIPKLLVRHDAMCNMCESGNIKTILKKLKQKDYSIISYPKVEAAFGGKKLVATNEISIRNRSPLYAIRFRVFIKNLKTKQINGTIIGDGIVTAAPFGASGYFYSIARKKFGSGIGLAFNNTTKKISPKILTKESIRFELVRGDAFLTADNDPRMIKLNAGDTVSIRQSTKQANIICLN